MKQTVQKAALAGILAEILYFVSVALFLITKTDWALTAWESMTVLGAFAMLLVLSVFAENYQITPFCRRLMLIALAGTLFFTTAAHAASIGVTRRLISQGVSVPDYYRIGFFPSYEMTLDYIGWGLFMGCAFLALYFGIRDKRMKRFSICCGILCLIGFAGSFLTESLWYPAPLGYGFGFLIMCISELRRKSG